MLVVPISGNMVNLTPRGRKSLIDRRPFGRRKLACVLPMTMSADDIGPVPMTVGVLSGVNQDFTASIAEFHSGPSGVRRILA